MTKIYLLLIVPQKRCFSFLRSMTYFFIGLPLAFSFPVGCLHSHLGCPIRSRLQKKHTSVMHVTAAPLFFGCLSIGPPIILLTRIDAAVWPNSDSVNHIHCLSRVSSWWLLLHTNTHTHTSSSQCSRFACCQLFCLAGYSLGSFESPEAFDWFCLLRSST